MRRKSTRTTTKASPEKVKEEKPPKKTRRHSKRHKPTSSESESEGEVSVSSNDNTTPVGGELWTVTQTEQSNNDIGKIKICLARPTPSTPDRTERASKRLRNKPAVQVEDSPSEEKPVRRTRRSRGGSSPIKKEELQQPQEHESTEEKKGKGKSKGKHKSKIVEQTAPVVEQTEMQSEISENVQVTAQSPQNVDNSDADIVDRDLNRFEDEKSGEKSGELPSPDDQDTNDNIVDASNNDLSNNNVANESQDMAPVDEQSTDANDVGIDNKEDCNKSLEQSESFADDDVSMKEVSAFYTTNDSKTEDHEAVLNDSQIETKIELEEAVKSEESEETPIKDETVSSEIKEESHPENNVTEQLTKHEDIKELPSSKEEVKQEFVKVEVPIENPNRDESEVKSEINEDRKVKNEESEPLEVGDKIVSKAENAETNKDDNEVVSDTNIRQIPAPFKEEPVIENIKEESSMQETSALNESFSEQSTDTPSETKLAMDDDTLGSKELEKIPQVGPSTQEILVDEKSEDTKVDLTEIRCSKAEERPEEICNVSENNPKQSEDDPQNKDDIPKTVDDAEHFPRTEDEIKSPKLESKPKRPLISKLWGQTSSEPNILYICTSHLLKMYPTVVLADEKELKLECMVRDRAQKKQAPVKPILVERRVSKEDTDNTAPKLERQDSNTLTNTNTNSIALNRKISIVEDEASSLRPPPSPAKHERSAVLFITNLVRPFTVKQLRGLLERTGKIVEGGFWTDRIKSKCYVQYETEEEAEATRNAIHGVLWPIGNGKKLIIDFSTTEEFENAKNPPIVQVQPTLPDTKAEPEKENHEPQKRLANMETTENVDNKPPHRNEKESRGRRGRSKSVSNKRQHSPSRRSRSPPEEIKKKRREEPAPQRAMDDLFRKTEATPSIYWQALQPEEIALKQKQRLERMEAHKRKMESQTHKRRNNDRQRSGPYRRRY